jgi:hypothetical protein
VKEQTTKARPKRVMISAKNARHVRKPHFHMLNC